MLDFYIIKDEQKKSSSPKNLEFAGGLNDITFNNLQIKGLIDKKHDYYNDFRWSEKIVEKKYNKILIDKITNNTDIKILFEILNKAIKMESGLIAFCD